MKILQISAKDTFPIREHMLNESSPLGEHAFVMDDDDLSFHLGAFVNNRLVSIASFYFEKHPYIDGENHCRICGMATLNEFQKNGYSTALLNAAIPLIKRNSCNLVWCNVRESAIGFYQKSGFHVQGESFELPEGGKHRLMIRSI